MLVSCVLREHRRIPMLPGTREAGSLGTRARERVVRNPERDGVEEALLVALGVPDSSRSGRALRRG
jgi:hypothetical protein